MTGTGTNSEKINNKNVWNMIDKQSISSSDDILSSVFERVKNYRKSKCPDCEYYVCSFWLKLGKSGGSEVTLTVKSTEYGTSRDEGRATFDNTAVNSWQLVQVPIKISRREIESIKFEFPKLLSPRITKTICQLHAEMEEGNTEYTYDSLGRMESKKHKIYHQTSYESNVMSEVEYKFGTTLKSKITTKLSRALNYVNTYEYNNTYNDRGLLVERIYTRGGSAVDESSPQGGERQTYTYDKANRLATESNEGETIAYSYTADGSIEKEKKGNVIIKQYTYAKGRLTSIKDEDENGDERVTEFGYDNLGNCTHYKQSRTESANMEWERGNLLKYYENAHTTYFYNSQGIRYKKVVGGTEVGYCLDGGKLLLEKEDISKCRLRMTGKES